MRMMIPSPAPHLVLDGRMQRCSFCNIPFLMDSKSALQATFANHVQARHQPNKDTNESGVKIRRTVLAPKYLQRPQP
jgi:hypothetical protein